MATKMTPTGLWRTVTTDDDTTALPDISTFAQNHELRRFVRVFADVYFHGDADANVDLRFAVGCRVDDLGESDTAMQAKGWIVQPALMFGMAVDVTPDSLASSETKQEHLTPNLTEGQYAIDVEVNGMDLWVSVSGFAAYGSGYTNQVRLRCVFFDK